jgi:hypothetical protein
VEFALFGGSAVQAAGGFVENEDFGLLEQGASDREALFMSTGKPHAALADFGLVALRQGFDGAVDCRHFAGMHDLAEGGVGIGHQQVVVDGAG